MKPGRNDPCTCGSGKKYKKCCAQQSGDNSNPVLSTGSRDGAGSRSGSKSHARLNELSQLNTLIRQGRYAELEHAASRLVHAQPDSGIGWKLLSFALWRQDKDAMEALEKAVALLPDDPEAHSNLGNALRRRGRPAEAAARHRRALALRAGDAETHNNLGSALLDLGQVEAAIACYREALRLRPNFALAGTNLGHALTALGRMDEAESSFRSALRVNPALTDAHIGLGSLLRELRRYHEAAACYRQALALKSDSAAALAGLGDALRCLGQLTEALTVCWRAVEVGPDLAEAHNHLGNALLEAGQPSQAVASYERAVALKPDLASAHSNLGGALRDLVQYEAAVRSCQRALELRPDGAELHNNLSVILRLLQRREEAEASARKAHEINPTLAAPLVSLAKLNADQGEFATAEELLWRALALDPDSLEACSAIPAMRRMTLDDDSWLAAAERMATQGLPPRRQAHLHYAMGKYFDDLRDFPQAFGHYQRANELKRQGSPPYDRAEIEDLVSLIIERCSGEWLGARTAGAVMASRPAFIVGMPRSGTTLAEQILASHPAIFGAGELPFWSQALADWSTTSPAIADSDEHLHALADGYLALINNLASGAAHVVDKMPANFLSLGLIHAALPNARIIHMRRHPIDTCLSIYFQDLEVGFPYANHLDDLAHYYGQYLRMMSHWRAVLPAGAVLHVPYEQLVSDQEAWSRRIVEFLGVDWDPVCLNFHQTRRTVTTASKWQVRQKITKSSVARWRNYQKFVGPLLSLTDSEHASCEPAPVPSLTPWQALTPLEPRAP